MKEKMNTKSVTVVKKIETAFNEWQKASINSTEKRLLTQAGAGTGKSATLLGTVDKLLNKDWIPGSDIQMITFTRSWVQNLKDRIKHFTDQEVWINTFHSFALKIIKENKDYFSDMLDPLSDLDNLNWTENLEKKNFRFLVDDFDAVYLIKQIYENKYSELDWLKTSDRNFYLSSIQKEIKNQKLAGIDPATFLKSIDTWKEEAIKEEESRVGKNGKPLWARKSEIEKIDKIYARKKDLAGIYGEYTKTLKSLGKIDFDDVIPSVVKFLKNNPDVATKYSESIKYMLVDEYQDTNKIQEELINVINPEFIRFVGDEKQAIFWFQWATSENILEKIESIPTIPLTENYRSGQLILDFADSVYRNSLETTSGYSPVKLTSKTSWEGVVKLVSFNWEYEEAMFIKDKIKSLISKWKAPEDIAVIYRNNSHWAGLAKALSEAWIPFNYSLDGAVFKKGNTKYVLNTLMLAFKWALVSNKSLYDALVPLSNFDDLEKFFYETNKAGIKIQFNWDIMDFVKDANLYLDKYPSVRESLEKLMKLVDISKSGAKVSDTVNELSKLLNYSFVTKEFLWKEKLDSDLASLSKFIESCEITDNGPLSVLKKIFFAQTIEYSTPSKEMETSGVNLITAHKSKWLEFSTVFVIKNNDSIWTPRTIGNFFWSESKNANEDLNLFYVALTRAKDELYLSYPKNKKGKETAMNKLIPMENLPAGVEIIDVDKDMTTTDNPFATSDLWKTWWEELAGKVKVSYSMLNKFFISPDTFRKEYILWLRDLPTKHTAWGILSHSLIKTRNKWLRTATNEDLQKQFESELKKYDEYLDENDKSEVLAKLPGFLTQLPELPTQKYSEAKVVSKINGIDIEGYIDWFTIEDWKIVITDYKSGKPKTENDILKTNDYDYKWTIAQLYFYKILLESATSFSYNNTLTKLPSNIVSKGKLIYFWENGIETKEFDLNDIDYENSLKEDISTFVWMVKEGYLWIN